MSKSGKNSLVVILIFIVIFAISWVAYDVYKQEPADANIADTNLADENTGLDNIINDLFENVIEDDEELNEIIDEKTNNDIEEGETTGSITSREEKAVQLVKNAWGEDDTVYFSYQSIDSQGRYIVSVNKKDTTVLAFFVVDVDNEIVTKQ